MNTPNKTRAVIYIRVSTQNQVDGFGLEMQEDKCKKMIDMKGWSLTKIYSDEGISGTLDTTGRPGLRQMLEDGENKLYDAMVCYALDRIGRKAILVLELVSKFDKMGIEIISCKESIDTSSPMGKFILGVMTHLVELERDTIVARMKEGKARRRLKDGNTGGRPPYGYTRDEEGNIIIHQAQANGVREIFRLRDEINEKGKPKYTLVDICKKLENKLILSPSHKTKWHPGTLHKILKRKEDYEGGLVNSNQNEIKWPTILKK